MLDAVTVSAWAVALLMFAAAVVAVVLALCVAMVAAAVLGAVVVAWILRPLAAWARRRRPTARPRPSVPALELPDGVPHVHG